MIRWVYEGLNRTQRIITNFVRRWAIETHHILTQKASIKKKKKLIKQMLHQTKER